MSKENTSIQNISDAEVRVLQVLWQESPLSAQAIIDRLAEEKPAHPRTVKTLINRLLNKGAIAYHEKDRKYHYYPLLEKSAFYQEKTDEFLGQFFNGEITPLLTFFSQQKKLSDTELQELKKLIDHMEKDDGN